MVYTANQTFTLLHLIIVKKNSNEFWSNSTEPVVGPDPRPIVPSQRNTEPTCEIQAGCYASRWLNVAVNYQLVVVAASASAAAVAYRQSAFRLPSDLRSTAKTSTHQLPVQLPKRFTQQVNYATGGDARSQNVGWTTGRVSKGGLEAEPPSGSRGRGPGRGRGQAPWSRKFFGVCTSTGVGKLAPFLTDPTSKKKHRSCVNPGKTSPGKNGVDMSTPIHPLATPLYTTPKHPQYDPDVSQNMYSSSASVVWSF